MIKIPHEPSVSKPKISFASSVGTFESFKRRDYRYLWLGTYSAAFGVWLQQASLGWFVFEITKSPFLVGVVIATRNVPFVVAGLGGGLAADRFNRRVLLGLMHILISIWALLFSITVLLHFAKWWVAAIYAFVNGIMWSFSQPIRQSMIAAVVPKHILPNAVALQTMAFNINMIMGPSVAGFLITYFGVEASFFLQSLAYLGMSACMWRIQLAEPKTEKNANLSISENLRAMSKYVLDNQFLISLVLIGLVFPLFVMSTIQLLPVFAADVLAVDARGLGILMSTIGVGALIGSLSLASLSNFSRKGATLVIVSVLVGIGIFVLGTSKGFLFAAGILLFIGICNIVGRVLIQTLLQLHTSDLFRGRILALYVMQQSFTTIGTLFAGALAEILDVGTAIMVIGIMTVVTVLLVVTFFRILIRTQ